MFGDWLCDMAAAEPGLVGITPAMREGSGMVRFAEQYPDRYFDVGIAEQHAVTFAAGFACEGLKPVVAIYSTFLQRGYDQLVHDVALQNLPVLFAIDRGGLVGADGPTHHGTFDISYLTCIPEHGGHDTRRRSGMPPDAVHRDKHQYGPVPCVIRAAPAWRSSRGTDLATLPIGKGEIRRRAGKGVALLAFGSMLAPALAAAEELDATVANMRFVKPIDRELIAQLAGEHSVLVSVEENALIGGAGAEVARAGRNRQCHSRSCGWVLPDRFIDHGDHARLLAELGLDCDGIIRAMQARQAVHRPKQ